MPARFVYRLIVILSLVSVFVSSAQTSEDILQRVLNNKAFSWLSYSSQNIKIYYQKDSFAQQHKSMLLRSIEKSVEEVLDTLHESASERLLSVFYVESREEMEQMIGYPVTGYAAWGVNAMFLVVNPEWRSFEKHEFAHIVTMGRWGRPAGSSRWMTEGIAIFCDGCCREYTVDEVAYALLKSGQLPALNKFFGNFSELGEIKAGFYAGSLIGFINERYGIETVRRLWQSGTGNIKEILGSETDQIEIMWKNYLKEKFRDNIEVDLKTISELGCG